MPQVTVRYFAGAREAAGTEWEYVEAETLGELKRTLATRPDLRGVCLASSFLVDGAQADEATPLATGAEVHVLPPFAGG